VKLFRKFIFWCHLLCGVVAGTIILLMSVTGVLLTYERQMIAWSDKRAAAAETAPSQEAAAPATVIAASLRAEGRPPGGVTIWRDKEMPVELTFGRERKLVSPHREAAVDSTGKARAFFQGVREWHRWLAMGEDKRALGKGITGACNLAFLGLVVTGFYLWFPRNWSWGNVRAVLLFRRGLRGKARSFNWHNVIGFWSAIPLAIIIASGAVISYKWAGNLVYAAWGEKPPGERRPPQAGESPRAAPAERSAAGDAARGRSASGANVSTETINQLTRQLEVATAKYPEWRSLNVRLASGNTSETVITVDEGTGGQPHLKTTLTFTAPTTDPAVEEFTQKSGGARWRSYLRFAHTGELWGIGGQTVAGIASLGAVFLVLTGFHLAWRRFRGNRSPKAEVAPPNAPMA